VPVHFYHKLGVLFTTMRCLLIAIILYTVSPGKLLGQEYRIFIDPKSNVSVFGSTNVSRFTFEYTEPITINKPVLVKKNDGGLKLQGGLIDLKVRAFDSGYGMMNGDFRKMLKEEINPFIQVVLVSLFPKWLPDGNWLEGTVEILVEMNNIKKKYTILCKIDNPGSLLIYGREKMRLTDFELVPPVRMMGMVKVNEYVDFDLSLRFSTDH
jgi:hypothetical protein